MLQPAVVVEVVWPSSVLLHMFDAPSEVQPLQGSIPWRPSFVFCAGDVVVSVVVAGWLTVMWCVDMGVVVVALRGRCAL